MFPKFKSTLMTEKDLAVTIQSPKCVLSRRDWNRQIFTYGNEKIKKKYNGIDNQLECEVLDKQIKNYVDLHSEGFINKENKDLIKHYLRLYKANKFRIKQNKKEKKKLLQAQVLEEQQQLMKQQDVQQITEQPPQTKKFLPAISKQLNFSIKEFDFVLQQKIEELSLLQKVITLYNDQYPSDQKKELVSCLENLKQKVMQKQIKITYVNDQFEYHDLQIHQQEIESVLVVEDIFIESIWRQILENGIRNISYPEFMDFSQIIGKRIKQLQEMHQDLNKLVIIKKQMEKKNQEQTLEKNLLKTFEQKIEQQKQWFELEVQVQKTSQQKQQQQQLYASQSQYNLQYKANTQFIPFSQNQSPDETLQSRNLSFFEDKKIQNYAKIQAVESILEPKNLTINQQSTHHTSQKSFDSLKSIIKKNPYPVPTKKISNDFTDPYQSGWNNRPLKTLSSINSITRQSEEQKQSPVFKDIQPIDPNQQKLEINRQILAKYDTFDVQSIEISVDEVDIIRWVSEQSQILQQNLQQIIMSIEDLHIFFQKIIQNIHQSLYHKIEKLSQSTLQDKIQKPKQTNNMQSYPIGSKSQYIKQIKLNQKQKIILLDQLGQFFKEFRNNIKSKPHSIIKTNQTIGQKKRKNQDEYHSDYSKHSDDPIKHTQIHNNTSEINKKYIDIYSHLLQNQHKDQQDFELQKKIFLQEQIIEGRHISYKTESSDDDQIIELKKQVQSNKVIFKKILQKCQKETKKVNNAKIKKQLLSPRFYQNEENQQFIKEFTQRKSLRVPEFDNIQNIKDEWQKKNQEKVENNNEITSEGGQNTEKLEIDQQNDENKETNQFTKEQKFELKIIENLNKNNDINKQSKQTIKDENHLIQTSKPENRKANTLVLVQTSGKFPVKSSGDSILQICERPSSQQSSSQKLNQKVMNKADSQFQSQQDEIKHSQDKSHDIEQQSPLISEIKQHISPKTEKTGPSQKNSSNKILKKQVKQQKIKNSQAQAQANQLEDLHSDIDLQSTRKQSSQDTGIPDSQIKQINKYSSLKADQLHEESAQKSLESRLQSPQQEIKQESQEIQNKEEEKPKIPKKNQTHKLQQIIQKIQQKQLTLDEIKKQFEQMTNNLRNKAGGPAQQNISLYYEKKEQIRLQLEKIKNILQNQLAKRDMSTVSVMMLQRPDQDQTLRFTDQINVPDMEVMEDTESPTNEAQDDQLSQIVQINAELNDDFLERLELFNEDTSFIQQIQQMIDEVDQYSLKDLYYLTTQSDVKHPPPSRQQSEPKTEKQDTGVKKLTIQDWKNKLIRAKDKNPLLKDYIQTKKEQIKNDQNLLKAFNYKIQKNEFKYNSRIINLSQPDIIALISTQQKGFDNFIQKTTC